MENLFGGDSQGQLFLQKLSQLAPQMLYDPMSLAQAAAQKAPPPAIAENATAVPENPMAKKLATIGKALTPTQPPTLKTYQPGQPPASHGSFAAPDITQLLMTALNNQFKGPQTPAPLGQLLGR